MTLDPQPPDGDRIATEVEREMEQRLYRLRHTVLAPAEYHIYLHPDDFTHIKDVASLIELDVQQCLNAAVARMNGRSSLLNFVLPRRPPVEVPRGGWAIHIKPALNGEVGPGELAIHSRLSVPQAPKFGSGAGTVRIVQTVVSGTERRTLERDEPHTAASGAPQAPPRHARRVTRALTYSDETGEHEFTIAKELIRDRPRRRGALGRRHARHRLEGVARALPHPARRRRPPLPPGRQHVGDVPERPARAQVRGYGPGSAGARAHRRRVDQARRPGDARVPR